MGVDVVYHVSIVVNGHCGLNSTKNSNGRAKLCSELSKTYEKTIKLLNDIQRSCF